VAARSMSSQDSSTKKRVVDVQVLSIVVQPIDSS
jgi:hypothetical protein